MLDVYHLYILIFAALELWLTQLFAVFLYNFIGHLAFWYSMKANNVCVCHRTSLVLAMALLN